MRSRFPPHPAGNAAETGGEVSPGETVPLPSRRIFIPAVLLPGQEEPKRDLAERGGDRFAPGAGWRIVLSCTFFANRAGKAAPAAVETTGGTAFVGHLPDRGRGGKFFFAMHANEFDKVNLGVIQTFRWENVGIRGKKWAY